MREILFRGKRIDNGEWVYGDLFKHDDGKTEIFEHKETLFVGKRLEGKWYEVNRNTIGQDTGLEDKNGVNIFEGDIVKYLDFLGRNRKDEVMFVNGAFVLKEFWFADGISLRENELEAIGNIYDNPELLEEP